jgi:hypothetical protein
LAEKLLFVAPPFNGLQDAIFNGLQDAITPRSVAVE